MSLGISQNENPENLKSFDEMVSSLEQNQIVYSFVNRINDLKKDGHRSFGIMSIGYPELQHRVILAASSLLQRYNLNEKRALVINSRSLVLQKFIKRATSYHKKYAGKDLSHYDFHSKFDFTVLDQFTNHYDSTEEHEYYNLIEEYSSAHDTILWDLPLIGDIKSNYELYFPILQQMSDVFLVLPRSGTSRDELTMIKEYFANFNVEIRGIMIETDKSKHKKWWEFWR